MSDSIREKILKDIYSTLEKVTISNGYQAELNTVQRWEQKGNDFIGPPGVIVVPDDENKTSENTWPETDCRLPVLLVFYFRHDKEVYNCSTDEVLSMFLASIEKAIMQDPFRDGNAIMTRNMGNNPFSPSEGQPHCGFIINLEVQYRHNTDDPYT